MHTETLDDVREAIQNGEKRTFQAMRVYITGFVAQNEFPVKFYYRGCTARKDDGFLCRKTVGGPRQCREHPTIAWANMFRFDVFVNDNTLSPTSPPLHVTLFAAASTLLGIEADSFGAMDEFSQYVFVHAATLKLAMVDVHLKYNPKDKFAIVERISGIPLGEDCQIITSHPGPTLRLRTATSTLGSTPCSARRVLPAAESSSLSSQKKDSAELLHELLESLGHTNLSDKF